MRLSGVLVLTAITAGCDGSTLTEPAAPQACSAVGARCQLPDGPLGVCQDFPCGSGQRPPCFKCTAQH